VGVSDAETAVLVANGVKVPVGEADAVEDGDVSVVEAGSKVDVPETSSRPGAQASRKNTKHRRIGYWKARMHSIINESVILATQPKRGGILVS